MITNVSLVNVFCLDQDKARVFYVDVLGFELRDDVTAGEGSGGSPSAIPANPSSSSR